MNKFLRKIKYPKLILLIISFIVAYFLFNSRYFNSFHAFLVSIGYLGTFLAGILYDYGFTAASATAILLLLAKEQNIFFSWIIASFGAVIGDLIIFGLIRHSGLRVKKTTKERIIRMLHIKNKRGTVKKYLIPAVGGLLIASPLPDEVGVALLAYSKHMSIKKFTIIAYVLDSIGIFIILSVGRII